MRVRTVGRRMHLGIANYTKSHLLMGTAILTILEK